jgi:hypothetical protein
MDEEDMDEEGVVLGSSPIDDEPGDVSIMLNVPETQEASHC